VGPVQRSRTPEERVLLLSARAQMSAARLTELSHVLDAALDWSLLLRLADRHGLSPLLWRALVASRPTDIPADCMAELRNRCHGIAANNLLLVAHLRKILELLASAGIEALAWKGPALAAEFYGDIGLREFGDLDLLVKQGDVGRARAVLESMGYERHYRLSPTQERMLHRYGHEEQFERQGQLVELHWAITKDIHAVPFDFDSLWLQKRNVRIGKFEAPTPGVEDLFLTLCIHGNSHGWQRLIWICDIAELIRVHTEIDWRRIMLESGRKRFGRMVRVALALASRALDASLLGEVQSWVEADAKALKLASRLEAGLFEEERARGSIVSYHMGIRETAGDKIAFAARALCQPAPEDWSSIALPAAAYPLYYIVRPLRLLRQYGIPFLKRQH